MNHHGIKNKKYFMYIDNNYFHINIYNPLKTWWKARKYFKMPTPHISFFFRYGLKKIDKDIADKYNIKTHKIFGKYYYVSDNLEAPYANFNYVGKIIDISSCDVMWKNKWNSPRHERDPYIYFCLFRLFGFYIHYKIMYMNQECEYKDGGMEYWEYLLDYLYFNKNLSIEWCWQRESKIYKYFDYKTDSYKPHMMIVPTPMFSLNKRGRKEFRKLINNN